jgi:hypothetical protein
MEKMEKFDTEIGRNKTLISPTSPKRWSEEASAKVARRGFRN